MKDLKLFLHGSYIGNTGYNNHTRDFVRHLHKLCKIKVRNFTIGKTWDGLNNRPHDNESYFNEVDSKVLYEQILWDLDGGRSNYKIYEDDSKNFKSDLHIVLCETNHHIFYDNYDGPRIAYNVWESTLLPENFFDRLNYFDEFWVPSKWQKDCVVKQGYPKEKVKVVPEGVDVKTFFPEEVNHPLTNDGRFKFFLAGRWDYRKSTKEIIETFINTFDKDEPVDLIVSVDNPYSNDGMSSTEERLEHYNLLDDRIKVLHFPERDDYIALLKSSNVFVSCARSEGWNLPLIESMSCGTPSIYSNCSGQLEFAEGKGVPVNILHELPLSASTYNHFNDNVGNYYEPDFNHLGEVMRKVYDNYEFFKTKSLKESEEIRNNFNWNTVAQIGVNTIEDFMGRKPWLNRPIKKNEISVSYNDGPKVEITGDEKLEYFIEFIDSKNNEVVHSSKISNNMWTSCSRKYYTEWTIKINGEIYDIFNIKNKKVLISLESKSWGDTIAWVPYAIEFYKKHNCDVYLSTFHNDWFIGLSEYNDIKFVNPGEEIDCYSTYRIGWFKNDEGLWDGEYMTPSQPNLIPLQKTASEILGLDFKEINYGVKFKDLGKYIKGKYVVIGTQSTAGCKEWEYDKWVQLSKRLNDMGYKVVTSTKDRYLMPNTINDATSSFDKICTLLKHSDFFIGLSSGLSWLNWSLGKRTVMIAGFTEDNHEFIKNNYRVSPNNQCIRCWNDSEFTFDAGDWDWCPVYKGTKKQHICQKSITVENVIKTIKKNIK